MSMSSKYPSTESPLLRSAPTMSCDTLMFWNPIPTGQIITQLREAFRSSRVDYPTNRDVVYAEVDGEFRFCVPGATRRPHRNRGQKREQRDGDEPMPDVKLPRSTVTHGATWDSIMTDQILRSNDEMKEIFKEESERRAGWTLGEVFSVINRRYGKSVEDWRNVADPQVEDFRKLRLDLRDIREENERLRRQVGGCERGRSVR